MYRRVLLAFDGSIEGRTALREGAIIARTYGAQTFLLAIAPTPATILSGGQVFAPSDEYSAVLAEGLQRARDIGVSAMGELTYGNPADMIPAYAKSFDADLVVIGHAKQSFWTDLLAPSDTRRLVDRLSCSLLVARLPISDAEIRERMALKPP